MFHTLLAPAFHARSKRRTLFCLVALLSLCLGTAWAKPIHPTNTVQPGTSLHALAAPPIASITGSQIGAGISNSTQDQTHLITNNGVVPQTFDLSASSRQAWTVTVTPAQVQVALERSGALCRCQLDPGVRLVRGVRFGRHVGS